MTPELTILTLAGLLQAVQFATMAIPANLELGVATRPMRKNNTCDTPRRRLGTL